MRGLNSASNGDLQAGRELSKKWGHILTYDSLANLKKSAAADRLRGERTVFRRQLAEDGGRRAEGGIRFATAVRVRYGSVMSTAVLELKQKVERLTSEERYELMQILEDIEDNALADKAEAEGKFISVDEYKKLSGEEQLA
jgi:hypothetical protein